MILTLQAVSLNEQALSSPINARFDAGGGTIGRADHSTLALPDPERFISRKQAEIVFTQGSFVIRNVGVANPITVAQQTLAAGESAPLRHGDEVRIGGYLLRAQCWTEGGGGQAAESTLPGFAPRAPSSRPGPALAAPASQTQPGKSPFSPSSPSSPIWPSAPSSPSPGAPALSRDNPFADLLGGASAPMAPAGRGDGDDPFADLLGGPPVAPAPGSRGAPAPAGSRAAPAPGTASPSAGARGRSPPDDPFAGLVPAGLDPVHGAVAAPSAAAARLPDDFDPFGSPPPAPPAPSPVGVGAAPADPFGDLFGGAPASPSVDQSFGLSPMGSGDDALARFMAEPAAGMAGTGAHGAAAPQALPGSSALPTDPLLLFGEGAAPPGPAAAPAADDHLPAVHAAYMPPKVQEAPAAPRAKAPLVPSPARALPTTPPKAAPIAAASIPETIVVPPAQPVAKPVGAAVIAPAGPPAPKMPPPPVPPPSPARAGPPAPAVAPAGAPRAAPSPALASPAGGDPSAALWHAFCAGAGVELPLPPGDSEARMRHIGRILRTAVDGTLQLIAVRASTKHELRAAVTQIQATNNNPLKFSPDATAGLEALLTPPQRGFLDGVSAMDDAMLDLVGHAIGTVAGMRAAIEGMLDRFDPAALETQLGAGSKLANLVPMNRKARLWELYLQHHRMIRDQAQEDFHNVFGRAFVAAYEQQVDRIEGERRRQRQKQQS